MDNRKMTCGLWSVILFPALVFSQNAGQPLTIDAGKGTKIETVWVAPGEFNMGSNEGAADEKPVHRVQITKGFWMGKFEVTQEQFEALMGKQPSGYKGARNPVENVAWSDADEFCKKLNASGALPAGVSCRLPTEAEWEYACRAGTSTRYYTGESEADLARAAWYGPSRVLLHGGNAGNRPHPVGEREPNKFGLYDMLGNVWEWCADWYGPYSGGGAIDPTGPADGKNRVRRGGAFPNPHQFISCAARGTGSPKSATSGTGFRVVCSPAK